MLKKTKVLLATPIATSEELWGQYKEGAGAYFPLGLLSIAGICLKEGFDTVICDASTLRLGRQEFKNFLLKHKFDVIGLGNCYTALAHLVFGTAKLCKEVLPESKIVLGGIHPTLFPEESLAACPETDFVVYGEGENSFLDILRCIEEGRADYSSIDGIAYRKNGDIVKNKPRALIEDLGSLPELPFELLEMDRYDPPPSNYKKLPTYGLLVQRGCPYQCVYCDPRVHGSRVRHDDIDKLIAMMKKLKNLYGMKGVLFHDSAFTVNMPFAEKLCRRMIEEKLDLTWTCYTRVDRVNPGLLALMKQAGCWAVAYGFESGNEESLKLIKKGVTLRQNIEAAEMTRHAGLQVIGSFIICLPGEDEVMVRRTIVFAKKLKLDTAVFFLPVPFPGTELYDLCKAEGGLVDNIKWEDYRQWMDQSKPLYINHKIGREKMVELYNYALRSFYISAGTILRSVSNIRSFADLNKYFTGFKSISKIIKASFVGRKIR